MFNIQKDFKTGFKNFYKGRFLGSWERKSHPRPEWQDKELVLRNEFIERSESIETKLNLILSHLNLEYVPETEKTEPAKLVTKEIITGATAYPSLKIAFMENMQPPKKKRGRPKKK